MFIWWSYFYNVKGTVQLLHFIQTVFSTQNNIKTCVVLVVNMCVVLVDLFLHC